MSLNDRFACSLVCESWAQAAAAATRRIIIKHRVQDLSCLQCWLEEHGEHLEALQLHECDGATLTALPCPQLQDLLLHGPRLGRILTLGSEVWGHIAAAKQLTSVSLAYASTGSDQADVVSALTALPDLQQLTCDVSIYGVEDRSDSSLLQQMAQLTYLEMAGPSLAALQPLSSLTKLQHLGITGDDDWAEADCPGLQELKALTGLHLWRTIEMPATISQLTALQQLVVYCTSPSAITGLQVLTALTKLKVGQLLDRIEQSLQLQLTGLQHLELVAAAPDTLPSLFVASCKQLRVLSLFGFSLSSPDSLVASSMLQHLELKCCRVAAADGAAEPVAWQQVFPGPGQLPHLTSLQLAGIKPFLQHSDMECMVAACCGGLQVLHLDTVQDSFAPVLARLPALTSLQFARVTDALCCPLPQLTGLKELRVKYSAQLSTTGLRQLAALEQLTSLGFSQEWCTFEEDSHTVQRLREVMLNKLPGCSRAIVNKVCIDGTRETAVVSTVVLMLLACCRHGRSWLSGVVGTQGIWT